MTFDDTNLLANSLLLSLCDPFERLHEARFQIEQGLFRESVKVEGTILDGSFTSEWI